MPNQRQPKATRNTHQKDTVWCAFRSMRNHPTADMVYEAAVKLDDKIGRATVYRILNSYLESGKAVRVPVYDGADRFDITTHPHNHARCKMCGGVEDIFSAPSLELPSPEMTDGFTVEGGAVMYYGICRKCRDAAV